jgi:hypothetical protein
VPSIFRIHGDNIVECERIVKIIVDETDPATIKTYLVSPSTIVTEITFIYQCHTFHWKLEMLPGFNKAGRRRWEGNVFDALRDNGSFLEETPDAIITSVDAGKETILCAMEFCSALQAGNQAWQRSGRAFSTGRTGCPYLYIVDFVKYELDSSTRKRKALRFPNPAVPYSYISFSQQTNNFVAQVYVKSEEFDKTRDRSLIDFNEGDFADKELAAFIVKTMAGFNTTAEEESILQKNLNVVSFLAKSSRPSTNFTSYQWETLYETPNDNIISYSLRESTFNFHKTITAKGHHGKSPEMLDLIDAYSVGLASRDLPFGIIPASKRRSFVLELANLYPSFDRRIISKLAQGSKDLILCLIKGFKPRGDDNRPDRGILPLAVMLTGNDTEIMTYIYGPVIEENYNKLINHPRQLAASNGLWKSIIALSDYVALDVPILSYRDRDEELLLDTSDLKQEYTQINPSPYGLTRPVFSSIPREYHEDDVDTGIHYLFAHLLHRICFEGMCNPPGGDWSGMSVLDKDYEVRWLSLPRVSIEVNGKRPDHVLQIFGVAQRPVLLAIESKERAIDLEPDVGNELINYIVNLMDYIPSVERKVRPALTDWRQSDEQVDANDYIMISAAAYLESEALLPSAVFRNSNCDMLFVMEPIDRGWNVNILCQTESAEILKNYLKRNVSALGNSAIYIR